MSVKQVSQQINSNAELFFNRTLQLKKNKTELQPIYAQHLENCSSDFPNKFTSVEYGGPIYRKDHVIVGGLNYVACVSDTGIRRKTITGSLLSIIQDRAIESQYYIISKESEYYRISNFTSSYYDPFQIKNFEVNVPISGGTSCSIIQSDDPQNPYFMVIIGSESNNYFYYYTYNKQTSEKVINNSYRANMYSNFGFTGFIDNRTAYVYNPTGSYKDEAQYSLIIEYYVIDIMTGGVLNKKQITPFPSEKWHIPYPFSFFRSGTLYLVVSSVTNQSAYRSALFCLDKETASVINVINAPIISNGVSPNTSLSSAKYYKLENGSYVSNMWTGAILKISSDGLSVLANNLTNTLDHGIYKNGIVNWLPAPSTSEEVYACACIKDLYNASCTMIFAGTGYSTEVDVIGIGKYVLAIYARSIIRVYAYTETTFVEVT